MSMLVVPSIICAIGVLLYCSFTFNYFYPNSTKSLSTMRNRKPLISPKLRLALNDELKKLRHQQKVMNHLSNKQGLLSKSVSALIKTLRSIKAGHDDMDTSFELEINNIVNARQAGVVAGLDYESAEGQFVEGAGSTTVEVDISTMGK